MAHSPDVSPAPGRAYASLSPAVWRGSTVVFDSIADFAARKHRQPDGYSYGVTGTPTARLLEDRIAELENGQHCVITPSGAAALTMVVLAYVRAGDHVLLSAASYGSLAALADKWLVNLGVEVEYYPPQAGADIEALIRPNTRLICLESPGSLTMEMCDVPAIAAVARRHGVLTMMDNTWASPLGFRPLDHGVDFSIEAATKFFSGHSDVLMGSVATTDAAHYAVLREAQSTLGLQVSPDDCFLVLRGLETFPCVCRRRAKAPIASPAGWPGNPWSSGSGIRHWPATPVMPCGSATTAARVACSPCNWCRPMRPLSMPFSMR